MNQFIVKKAGFKKRIIRWAEKIDVTVSSMVIRRMKTKWASCSTSGRFTFDEKLIELPGKLQDYVIVHELLHFQVPNHGKLWKSLMRAHLGDYEALEEELKSLKTEKVNRRGT